MFALPPPESSKRSVSLELPSPQLTSTEALVGKLPGDDISKKKEAAEKKKIQFMIIMSYYKRPALQEVKVTAETPQNA
ncbi:hypothetical protein E2C01_040317 [Portunus trituberculatus]|uniref:Uncharacterized protein n=1 Tax=Portunus trituberculatus TaxID=210409 RepID=A0A5B7FQG5_PORTR|nr:hypothetical protein [Portunus trituberculatus]